MNKISIENAEKLTPQELVELIINNVPYNNIRSCLSNLETNTQQQQQQQQQDVDINEPLEKPKYVKPVEVMKQPLQKIANEDNNELVSLRNMCKDDPILIIETNKKIKNKEEPQVIYYAKSKKDNKFKKFSLDVSKFNKSTCSKLAEEQDVICAATSEWIDEQLDSGKDIKEIKNVIKDYISSGINLYISKCPNFESIKEKLDIETKKATKVPEVDESGLSALELSMLYTPNSNYIIYTKDRKENKIRVAYYNEDVKSWVTEDKDKSFISIIKNSKSFEYDSPKYRLMENAAGSMISGSPKYKNLSLIIKDVSSKGIKLPYQFLNNLID